MYLDVREYMSTARRNKRGREKRDKTRQEVQMMPREIMTVNVCITVDQQWYNHRIDPQDSRAHPRSTAHAHARPPIHASVNCL